MLREVTLDGASWHDLPWKFEAGTPADAQGIGLAAAVTYWQERIPLQSIGGSRPLFY
jgi:cysteine desulfurase/selenocysteine lyase